MSEVKTILNLRVLVGPITSAIMRNYYGPWLGANSKVSGYVVERMNYEGVKWR